MSNAGIRLPLGERFSIRLMFICSSVRADWVWQIRHRPDKRFSLMNCRGTRLFHTDWVLLCGWNYLIRGRCAQVMPCRLFALCEVYVESERERELHNGLPIRLGVLEIWQSIKSINGISQAPIPSRAPHCRQHSPPSKRGVHQIQWVLQSLQHPVPRFAWWQVVVWLMLESCPSQWATSCSLSMHR